MSENDEKKDEVAENAIPFPFPFNAEEFLAAEEITAVNPGQKPVFREQPKEKTEEELAAEAAAKQDEGKTEEELAAEAAAEHEEEDKTEYSLDSNFDEYSKKEEEPKEFKAEDYATMAKTLGVKIENQEDLDAVMAKMKTPEEENKSLENSYDYSAYDFTEEEQKSLENIEGALTSLKTISDIDLMKFELKSKDPKKYEGEEGETELDYQVNVLSDSGILTDQAKLVKEKYLQELTVNKAKIIDKAKASYEQNESSIREELQASLKSYEEGFHGVTVTPKNLVQTYQAINDGSIFEEIESNQANVAEMGLLWKNRHLFYKAMENPSKGPGIKTFMDDLQNAKPKPAAGSNTLKNDFTFDPQKFLEADISVKK